MVLLRSKDSKHIIQRGTSAGEIALSAIREAAGKDRRITLLSGECADPDGEVRSILVKKSISSSGRFNHIG